jgi:hypothetical protein
VTAQELMAGRAASHSAATERPSMIFIRLYHRLDGCEISDGNEYLMVASNEVDANGDWIPTRIEPVKNNDELRNVFRKLIQSGDKFVVRCSRNLWGLPAKLGIPMLSCEWGVL